jgi:hypothetical protein
VAQIKILEGRLPWIMKKLYLDIDGVLLTAKQTKPAENVVQFINFVTSNFDCYWLTTHCKGSKKTALNYLEKHFDDTTLYKMKNIKPTNWTTLKTEGIDFTSDFFWLEDFPFQSEINILENKKLKERLITVDLNRPDELLRIIAFLENSISSSVE